MYEYGNARIRGLRGLLLRPRDLEALGAVGSLTDFTASLAHTDYQSDLEELRGRFSGFTLAESALQANLSRRVRGLLGFFSSAGPDEPSRPRVLLGLLLARWDAANLIAICRGKMADTPPEDVLSGVLAAGELDAAQLAALAQLPDVSACIGQLMRWHVPFAGPLAGLDPSQWEAERSVQPLEMALWGALSDWSRAALHGRDSDTAIVREALALHADVVNVKSVVRMLYRRVDPVDSRPVDVFVPGGTLPLDRLAAALSCSSAAEGVASLRKSPLTRAVESGRGATTGDEASDAELALEDYAARWAQAQIFRDPLGISVALAYHVAKVQEVRRLRLIARGLHAGWPRYRLGELVAAAGGPPR